MARVPDWPEHGVAMQISQFKRMPTPYFLVQFAVVYFILMSTHLGASFASTFVGC